MTDSEETLGERVSNRIDDPRFWVAGGIATVSLGLAIWWPYVLADPHALPDNGRAYAHFLGFSSALLATRVMGT